MIGMIKKKSKRQVQRAQNILKMVVKHEKPTTTPPLLTTTKTK